jgi:hypothetical protein
MRLLGEIEHYVAQEDVVELAHRGRKGQLIAAEVGYAEVAQLGCDGPVFAGASYFEATVAFISLRPDDSQPPQGWLCR